MRALVFNVDVTPPVGLPMGGNVREDDKARGTHDALFANVVILEENGEKICFIGLDYVGLDIGSCNELRDSIISMYDIKRENIIINATHTHSGPDVLGIFKDKPDIMAKQYFADAVLKISHAFKNQENNMFDAKLKYARTRVEGLSFNRRLVMKDKNVRMNWEGVDPEDVVRETGPVDDELHVISIEKTDGGIAGLFVNFTLHPAILVGEDWLWSRDYIGYLTDHLKDKVSEDLVVLFTNGAEGNVNHINYRDRNQKRGFAEAERIGTALGENIYRLMQDLRNVDISDNFKCKYKSIKLPLREITKEKLNWAQELLLKSGDFIPSLLDGVPDEIYAREIIKLSREKEDHIYTDINAVHLGDILIVTFPGEVFAEFALYAKANSGYENTIVTGLANDIAGYIPTKEAFDEGGYEIKTAATSKLDVNAGYILTEEVLKLAGSPV